MDIPNNNNNVSSATIRSTVGNVAGKKFQNIRSKKVFQMFSKNVNFFIKSGWEMFKKFKMCLKCHEKNTNFNKVYM